jgi:cell pole-organizing protein PopZ
MQQGGEPSLEDILASIKKVMARDEAGFAGTDGDPIEPVHEDEAGDILDLAEADMVLEEVAPAALPDGTEPGGSGPVVSPPTSGSDSSRRDAANAVRESLAALERLSQSAPRPASGGLADPSVEAITRAMLRPMLAEWLEANLPAIVERLVQAEIERIVDRDA